VEEVATVMEEAAMATTIMVAEVLSALVHHHHQSSSGMIKDELQIIMKLTMILPIDKQPPIKIWEIKHEKLISEVQVETSLLLFKVFQGPCSNKILFAILYWTD
jgi:hypothetical protein